MMSNIASPSDEFNDDDPRKHFSINANARLTANYRPEASQKEALSHANKNDIPEMNRDNNEFHLMQFAIASLTLVAMFYIGVGGRRSSANEEPGLIIPNDR